MSYPDWFPNNCPPLNSTPRDGVFFRFVKTIPPNDSDFLCHVLLHPTKDYRGSLRCIACGISIYDDQRDMEESKKRNPAFNNYLIANGKLNISDGLLKEEKKLFGSHFTFWAYNGVDVKNLFI